MDLLGIASLVIWPLFLWISYLLFGTARLNIRKHSFSNLGSTHSAGYLFNLMLVGAALIESAFLYRYLRISGQLLQIAVFLFLLTAVCGLITAVFPERTHLVTHRVIGGAGFALSGLGWLSFSLGLYPHLPVPAILVAVWTVLVNAEILTHFDRKILRLPALYESIMFTGAFLANLILIAVVS